MTGEHEVVSTMSSIPIGVPSGHQSHIIGYKPLYRTDVSGEWNIEVLDHQGHTKWQKEHVRGIGIFGPEHPKSLLHFMKESSFN